MHRCQFTWEPDGWVLDPDPEQHPAAEQTDALFTLSPLQGCLAVTAGWVTMQTRQSIAPTGLSYPTPFGVVLIWCGGDSVSAAETYTRLCLRHHTVPQMWELHPRLDPLSVFGRLHLPDLDDPESLKVTWDDVDVSRDDWEPQFGRITPWAAAWWHREGFTAPDAARTWRELAHQPVTV